MAVKVTPVVLDGDLGRKWWEIPDALWRRRDTVRDRRLHVTLARHILPVLQELETLQLEKFPNARMVLKGKRVEDVENDPVALEFALFLYELALSEDLIRTDQGKKAPSRSIRSGLDLPAGSCGLTPNQVVRTFVRRLAEPILTEGGHDPDDLGVFLSAGAQTKVGSLARLRILSRLDKAIIQEMRLGLGSLSPLLKKDKAWLAALGHADVGEFLRPLRNVLQHGFETILDWPTGLLLAAAKAMTSSIKVTALGANILDITNPAIFPALASWPIGKDKDGRPVARIALIKKQVGEKLFCQMLGGSPGLLKDLGTWPAPKIQIYKPYLGFLTGPSMQILGVIDPDQHLALLDGMTRKYGPRMISQAFSSKDGLIMLQGIVNEIVTMNRTAKQPPEKVRNLVAGTYFDDYTAGFIASLEQT